MRVAIGVSSGEIARYSVFWNSLLCVRGVTPHNVMCSRGANIAENRNCIAERALMDRYDAVWYVDDDQVFSPDTLEKLISHDVDIVSGLYLKREIPWIPHMYMDTESRGWTPKLLQAGDCGLHEVHTTGAGCLLVKSDVLANMEVPLWRLGQYDKVNWSDDHDFLTRARAKGYRVFIDLDCPVGHMTNATIWPVRDSDGTWKSVLVQGNGAIAMWPAAMEHPDAKAGET